MDGKISQAWAFTNCSVFSGMISEPIATRSLLIAIQVVRICANTIQALGIV